MLLTLSNLVAPDALMLMYLTAINAADTQFKCT
jgi:hypothetical protein